MACSRLKRCGADEIVAVCDPARTTLTRQLLPVACRFIVSDAIGLLLGCRQEAQRALVGQPIRRTPVLEVAHSQINALVVRMADLAVCTEGTDDGWGHRGTGNGDNNGSIQSQVSSP